MSVRVVKHANPFKLMNCSLIAFYLNLDETAENFAALLTDEQ